MEAEQPERGGGTEPRLGCPAAMEALAKIAGGVTGQGFGTAGTPWKGWESCDLCVVLFLSILSCRNGRNCDVEVWLVINLNLIKIE